MKIKDIIFKTIHLVELGAIGFDSRMEGLEEQAEVVDPR